MISTVTVSEQIHLNHMVLRKIASHDSILHTTRKQVKSMNGVVDEQLPVGWNTELDDRDLMKPNIIITAVWKYSTY